MNSTTTVTDANVPHISHVGTDNSMVALHVPSSQLRNTESNPNSFFNDVLLLETDEHPGSAETFYIEGEPVNSSGSANASIDNSPLLLRDPNLYSASQESQTMSKLLGPPPRKRKRMSPTYQRLHIDVGSPSSLCNSPPSPSHVNWPCAFCERFFSLKTSLYKHYRTIHPNRHCAKCVNPNLELSKTTKTTKKGKTKKKKSQEEIEDDLKVKYGIGECRVLVKKLTQADILENTQLPPMLRSFDYPRMYSSKKVQLIDLENDENMMGKDVLIGNDILTQEIVIEAAKVKKDLLPNRDVSPKSTGDAAQKTSETFDCDVCEKIFKQKTALIAHKRFKHSEKLVPNLKCDKCSQDFVQLMCYQQHVQNCGKEAPYRYRNMFEELTNFRPLQIDRKNEMNCFAKPDPAPIDREEDDDAIIMQAEQQLLNSPTSSYKSEYDDTGNSMQVDARVTRKRKLSDEVPAKREEPRRKHYRKRPKKRKLEIVKNSVKRTERVYKNAVHSSPTVAVKRVETVQSSNPTQPKRKIGRPRKNKIVEPPPVKRKRGRPKKVKTKFPRKERVEPKPKTESTVTGTIRLVDDDDFSFSSDDMENGNGPSTESDFVDVENDDEGDLNLTLSDDETLGINISEELDLMDFNEEEVEIDVTNFIDEDVDVTSQVQVGTASEQLHGAEKKSRNLSDCFSVFV